MKTVSSRAPLPPPLFPTPRGCSVGRLSLSRSSVFVWSYIAIMLSLPTYLTALKLGKSVFCHVCLLGLSKFGSESVECAAVIR